MGNRSHALMAGLFLFALTSAIVLIVRWMTDYTVERKPYIVFTRGSVAGLEVEAPVSYRGVAAGKVTEIGFDRDDPRNVLIHIEVDKAIPLTRGVYATMRLQGVTGLSQIELLDSNENPDLLDTTADRPARIAMRPSWIDKLADSGDEMLQQADKLIDRLNVLFDEENSGRMRRILANVEAATERLAGLEERMDKAFAEAPALSAKARDTLAHVDGLALDLKALAGRLGRVADSVEAVAGTGRAAGETLTKATLPRVNTLLDDLHTTTVRFGRVSGMIERNPEALLFGTPPPEPGPGEPGYVEPR